MSTILRQCRLRGIGLTRFRWTRLVPADLWSCRRGWEQASQAPDQLEESVSSRHRPFSFFADLTLSVSQALSSETVRLVRSEFTLGQKLTSLPILDV